MAEMRKVQLTDNAKALGLTATFNFENRRYFLDFNTVLNIPYIDALTWVTANSNVQIMAGE